MAEVIRTERLSSEERIELLTATYRRILGLYEKIERQGLKGREFLRAGKSVREVVEVLTRKREFLKSIRAEEERVSVAREWWKNSRRSLSDASCRELVPLLDEISRKIERVLALEAECRELLDQRLAWGTNAAEPSLASASSAATLAYERAISNGRKGVAR